MFLFIFFTWITILLFPVDYASESLVVGSYRTHFENSRYRRNTLEKLNCVTEIQHQGIELINFGIKAIYMDFNSTTIDIRDNFYDTLENLYKLSGTQKPVREFVTRELYKFKDRIKGKDFKDIPSFKKAIIHFYTTFYAYKEINACLREHECNKKILTKEEKYLAPYSAVLMSVLLYWPKLIKEKGTTYRGVNLDQRQIDEFTEGLKFTWPSFISSSGIEAGASKKDFTCQFVFDNSENTKWSPRQIWNYAHDKKQNEALYPPGVQFQIIKKQINDDGQAKIHLKLLGPVKDNDIWIWLAVVVFVLLIICVALILFICRPPQHPIQDEPLLELKEITDHNYRKELHSSYNDKHLDYQHLFDTVQ